MEPSPTSRAVVYCRLSRDDGDSSRMKDSLAIQADLCMRYTRRLGLPVVAVLGDRNVSGSIPFFERPQGAVAGQIFKSSLADTLVVSKADRLSRDLYLSLGLAKALHEDYKVSLHLVDGLLRGEVDLSRPDSFFVFALQGTIAELERKRTQERNAAVVSYRRKRGLVYCGNRFGYKTEKRDSVHVWVPNKKQVEALQIIYDLRMKLISWKRIATELNLRKFRTTQGKVWNWRSVYQTFSRALADGRIAELLGETAYHEFMENGPGKRDIREGQKLKAFNNKADLLDERYRKE